MNSVEIAQINVQHVCAAFVATVEAGSVHNNRKSELRIAVCDLVSILARLKVDMPEYWGNYSDTEFNYTEIRTRVAAGYPALGYYWWQLHSFDGPKEPGWTLGDAIDKIADIVLAVRIYLADEQRSPQNALYSLKESYHIHLLPDHIPGLMGQLALREL
jgi:hypothetical protein